jgi:hypothetical protein
VYAQLFGLGSAGQGVGFFLAATTLVRFANVRVSRGRGRALSWEVVVGVLLRRTGLCCHDDPVGTVLVRAAMERDRSSHRAEE